MDPNAGRFIDGETAPAWMTRYEVGEVLKVKGEEFEVIAIRERELVLKPLSAEDRAVRAINFDARADSIRRGRDRRRDAKRGRKP